MGIMTTDEKFSDFLARAARSYNEPPAEVPREEMWAAVGERRRGAAPRRRLHFAAWIGMAATLAIGVGIGRYTVRRDAGSDSAQAAPATSVAGANGVNGAIGAAGGNVAYRLAARDHLARAEALLTAYRTSDSLGAPNTQITEWAEDVLQNTRLLLDSPAAADPSRQQLLRDLEAVLVQMIQRSPGPVGAEEARAQVYRSIERTHVLTRLRSAQPVGSNGSN
jgi:hypothetical protein